MKLLTEQHYDVDILDESATSGNIYIEGHFIQTNKINRNKRLYESKMMEPVVEKYINEVMNQNKAWGEFEHPDYPLPDPMKSVIKIVEMRWDGDNVYGKAALVETVPYGINLKALLKVGGRFGVSTRALGETKRHKYMNEDCNLVTSLMLNAVDVVSTPSGQDCMVNSLTESANWVRNQVGLWIQEAIKNDKLIDTSLFQQKIEEQIIRWKKSL